MSDTFTLTVLGAETPGQAPAHESTHTNLLAATAKLWSILCEAGEGDRAVPHIEDWSRQRTVFNLIDVLGNPVGTAVIERG